MVNNFLHAQDLLCITVTILNYMGMRRSFISIRIYGCITNSIPIPIFNKNGLRISADYWHTSTTYRDSCTLYYGDQACWVRCAVEARKSGMPCFFVLIPTIRYYCITSPLNAQIFDCSILYIDTFSLHSPCHM